MADKELITIHGAVENVVYRNDDTGFTVLELQNGFDQITVVGEICDASEGEELDVTGCYTTHPTFGVQFKAYHWERKLPATAGAILKYLSSGAIKGVGAITARRMVEAFGDETLEVAYHTPEKLTEVKGISPKKALEIGQEFKRIFSLRETMAFLSAMGVGAQQAIFAYKAFGEQTVDIIRDNPYMLCTSDIGIGFDTAERVAVELGIGGDAPCRVRAGILHVLLYNMNNGHTCLPRNRLVTVSKELLEVDEVILDDAVEDMIREGELAKEKTAGKEYLFLPWLYSSQIYISTRLAQMEKLMRSDTPKNIDKLIQMQEDVGGIQYAALQRQAIACSLSSGVMVLTGGPGTGKTTTVNGIIGVLEGQGNKVVLTAPTGRAAKRLSEVTGKEAKTIHRLLESTVENNRHKFSRNEKNPLRADVVIVDEMSMVDTYLLEALLRALKPSCRVILVGDADQLPSVGAGNLLGDITESGCFPVICLSEIFRQAAESLIVVGAHSIVRGEMPNLSRRDSDFFFLGTDRSETPGVIVDLCSRRLPATYGYSPVWDIQVLSPGRKGEIGTENLNRLLQQKLNPPDPGKREVSYFGMVFREGDKVMQIKNNYDIVWSRMDERGTGVFNGDIGAIQSIDRMAGTMRINFDERVCDYPIEMVGELELAYAVTVHKSQGSEFEAVIIPIAPTGGKLYYRNLLYTAVTRAKKLLILVGHPGGIRQMVENDRRTLRYTLLRMMIRRECGGMSDEGAE